MNLRFHKINGTFACEIKDQFLWGDLDAKMVEEMRDLLAEHGVIVFRHQALSEPELVHIAGRIGTLEPSIRYDWASKYERDVGYISNMRDPTGNPIGGLGSGEVLWHTDQSYHQNPVTGAMLYCVETPPRVGRTSWASLVMAYEALPEATKKRIEKYTAIFSYDQRLSTYDKKSQASNDIRQKTPPVKHKLVTHHPGTNRKALYLDPATTIGIEGLSNDEGEALLAELNEHATQERFVYTHEWSVGDVVMWDNGQVLHRREPHDATQSRLLKRLQFRLPETEFICPV